MKFLDSIAIEKYETDPPKSEQQRHSLAPFSTRNLCMTPGVILRLNPLKSFQITSAPGNIMQYTWHMVTFTRSVMDALLKYKSLQTLIIKQEYAHPEQEQDVLEILHVVSTTDITTDIPDISLELILPASLRSMDPKHFIPPKTGKSIDIFVHTMNYAHAQVYLKVGRGRYLLNAEVIELRKKLFEVKTGQTILTHHEQHPPKRLKTLDAQFQNH